jgi:predicted nucleic acid-binding protein
LSRSLPFLGTNILLRHLRQDNPEQSPRATAVLARIEQGDPVVRTADTVIFETVFCFQRGYQQPCTLIAAALLPLIGLPGIVLPSRRSYRDIFHMYEISPLGIANCYHVVLMKGHGSSEIFSFDRHFDHVSGIT